MSLVSVVVPFFNEEKALPELMRRLDAVAESAEHDFEVILVDNASTDASREIVLDRCRANTSYRYIRFSRNFGPSVEASLSAGYRVASGDAVVVLYSDLQDPPELIPRLIEEWEAGADVVYGQQTARRGEPPWRRLAVRLFYRIMNRMSDSPVQLHAGDFRLISRRVKDVLNDLPETVRFTRALIPWIGFRQVEVPYVRNPRHSGASKANLSAISSTALTALTSFSLKPLQLVSSIGLVIAVFSVLGMVSYGIFFALGRTIPGVATIVILLFFSLGVNMVILGLIGAYVGRIFLEVKRRPLYVVEDTVNVVGPGWVDPSQT